MAYYVKIRRKSNPSITRDINADIWKVEVERFKGKEYDWEEVFPKKVIIQKRVENVTEKKSEDVAVSLIPNTEKVLEEITKPDLGNGALSETIQPEPKKRGRPRIEK